jgi:hypothetical protein
MDEVLDKKGVDIFEDALKHPPVVNPTNLSDRTWKMLINDTDKMSHKQVWTNSTKVI